MLQVNGSPAQLAVEVEPQPLSTDRHASTTFTTPPGTCSEATRSMHPTRSKYRYQGSPWQGYRPTISGAQAFLADLPLAQTSDVEIDVHPKPFRPKPMALPFRDVPRPCCGPPGGDSSQSARREGGTAVVSCLRAVGTGPGQGAHQTGAPCVSRGVRARVLLFSDIFRGRFSAFIQR